MSEKVGSREIIRRWETVQHGIIYRIELCTNGYYYIRYRFDDQSWWYDEAQWFPNYTGARRNLKLHKYCTNRFKEVDIN